MRARAPTNRETISRGASNPLFSFFIRSFDCSFLKAKD